MEMLRSWKRPPGADESRAQRQRPSRSISLNDSRRAGRAQNDPENGNVMGQRPAEGASEEDTVK